MINIKEYTSFYVILGILSINDSSGYDIKKKIENEIGYFYKVSNGQIYPALKKLTMKNYVTSIVEKNVGKPDRKVYTITGKGLEALKEWLEIRPDCVIENENELLLKLYFGSIISIEKNIELINDFKDIKERNLRAYNNIAKIFNLSCINEMSDVYRFFALRFGQIVAKAYIDWSEEAIEFLQTKIKESD